MGLTDLKEMYVSISNLMDKQSGQDDFTTTASTISYSMYQSEENAETNIEEIEDIAIIEYPTVIILPQMEKDDIFTLPQQDDYDSDTSIETG